ncbi:MAG: SPOR domain-containing protein [Bdellovibrionales bacterium]|nr:SPOR domain-containing protein [Bdellovibrionales bacterium]
MKKTDQKKGMSIMNGGKSMISNEFGGSKADTAVKLVLIFFISLFSFSVGTFVGKQVSDTERRRAALEEDYGKSRAVASESHGEQDKDHLSKEDVESLTKEFLAAEDGHEEKGHGQAEEKKHEKNEHAKTEETSEHKEGYKKVHGEKSEHKSAQDSHTTEESNDKAETHEPKSAHNVPVTKEAERVAHGKAPTEMVEKKRQVSSVLPKMPPTAIGKYTVQVSSYPTEDEAKDHAKELKKSGYSAFYIPAVVKGKTWYRVSIGLFDSYKSANYFRQELGKQSKMNSTIIQKIVK